MIKFITSQDSVYIFDEKTNKSQRTKNSGGSSQGKTFEFLTVVFLKEKVRLYYPSIRVDIAIFDKEKGNLRRIENISIETIESLNEKNILVVFESKRDNDNDILHMQRAHLKPEVGLYPFEIGYDNGKRIKHIGNEIVEVINLDKESNFK